MIEKEIKFKDIDYEEIKKRLIGIGATDEGKENIDDIIYYDSDDRWKEVHGRIRVRKAGNTTTLAYKDNQTGSAIDTNEIETEVRDFEKIKIILSKLPVYIARYQQKRRHKFTYKNFVFDFDEWPNNRSFLEVEGQDESEMQEVCGWLGLDWNTRILGSSLHALETHYNEPVSTYTYYTFDKIE